MVNWYIFDIGTVLISVRLNELVSLRDVGSTDLTLAARCRLLVELGVLISST